MPKTVEHKIRKMLKRIGVNYPESYTSSALVELTNLMVEVKALRKRTKLLEGLLWATLCWVRPTKDKAFNNHLDDIKKAL